MIPALSQLTDEQLVKKYRATGDTQFIGILFKRYGHLLLGLCFKYTGQLEDAEDKAMDIFELVMDKLKTYDVTHFRSWLFIVSKNFLLRGKDKNPAGKIVSMDGNEIFPENFMENQEKMSLNSEADENVLLDVKEENVRLAVGKLKEDQKICIQMFYFEEKPYKEIADLTGFDLNQVKSNIQNGKRNLKTLLEN